MYKTQKIGVSKLTGVPQYKADSIEERVRKIMNNKEPIKDGAPIIYTERKEGVKAGYNIRTDRFEVAVDAMDYATRSHIAKREAKVVEMTKSKDAVGESLQGTDGEAK